MIRIERKNRFSNPSGHVHLSPGIASTELLELHRKNPVPFRDLIAERFMQAADSSQLHGKNESEAYGKIGSSILSSSRLLTILSYRFPDVHRRTEAISELDSRAKVEYSEKISLVGALDRDPSAFELLDILKEKAKSKDNNPKSKNFTLDAIDTYMKIYKKMLREAPSSNFPFSS